jgi:hypothetical protein
LLVLSSPCSSSIASFAHRTYSLFFSTPIASSARPIGSSARPLAPFAPPTDYSARPADYSARPTDYSARRTDYSARSISLLHVLFPCSSYSVGIVCFLIFCARQILTVPVRTKWPATPLTLT